MQEKSRLSPLPAWFDKTIGRYLSSEHVRQEPSPCPLAFLVTDINKRDQQVRSSYTRVYKNLLRLLKGRCGKQPDHDATAMVLSALMIGGVALARAVDDERLAERLLQNCRETARHMLLAE